MSRQDTFVGLSPEALKMVEGCGKDHLKGTVERKEVVIGSSCRYTTFIELPLVEPCVKVEEGPFKAKGMYENQYPLSKYTFRDGTIYLEVQQASVWDSGPTIYTCLADTSGTHINESEWTKEELDNFHPGYFGPTEEEEQELVEKY